MSFLALLLLSAVEAGRSETSCVSPPVPEICIALPRDGLHAGFAAGKGTARPHGMRQAEAATGAELIRPVIGMARGFDPGMLCISTILQIITVHRQLAITGSAVWGQIVRIRRMDFPLIFSLSRNRRHPASVPARPCCIPGCRRVVQGGSGRNSRRDGRFGGTIVS